MAAKLYSANRAGIGLNGPRRSYFIYIYICARGKLNYERNYSDARDIRDCAPTNRVSMIRRLILAVDERADFQCVDIVSLAAVRDRFNYHVRSRTLWDICWKKVFLGLIKNF